MNTILVVFVLYFTCCKGAANTPPATLQDETYNWPQAPLPFTLGVLPRYSVPLASGARNVLDLTFGTGPEATIRNVSQLGNVAYFFSLFGSVTNVRSSPTNGIPENFKGVYAFYNEFLPNGTRNPLAVHRVLSDRLRLVARTAMNGSTSGGQYETGHIRLPFQFKPGQLAEITLAPGGWPTCRWSWPTFWAFSGVMTYPATAQNYSRWYGTPSLEIDGIDGYPVDNSTQGKTIATGAPTYGNDTTYNFPDDLYLKRTGEWQALGSGGGGSGVNRIATSPSNDPTNPNNPRLVICMDWTDVNTIKWIINGQLVRVRHVNYPAKYSTRNYDGRQAPPANLLNTTIPMFIMVSHQFASTFNPIDLRLLANTTGHIEAYYDVQSIRVWDRPSTLVPPSATPSPGALPPPRTGTALGDLPAITSGTYVINVEVVNGVLRDQYGGNVSFTANAGISTTLLNGRTAAAMYNGGISVVSSALFWAQNSNFVLFQSSANRNPFISTQGTYAQFIQAYPGREWANNKATLLMNPGRGFQARVATNVSVSAVNTSSGLCTLNEPTLLTLSQTVSGGTVKVGVGFGSIVIPPSASGGVPVGQLTGYTELLIGSGRNRYGALTTGLNLLHGQTLMVATGTGTLSDNDRRLITNYFITKWGCRNATLP